MINQYNPHKKYIFQSLQLLCLYVNFRFIKHLRSSEKLES